MICKECYSELNRITPLKDAIKCLSEHTQYICSTCGRCICFEKDSKRNVMRWNFPFTTLENAKLYLRAADYYCKKNCGIYKLTSDNGRVFYKIFKDEQSLSEYLQKNTDKACKNKKPVFSGTNMLNFRIQKCEGLQKMKYDSILIKQINWNLWRELWKQTKSGYNGQLNYKALHKRA